MQNYRTFIIIIIFIVSIICGNVFAQPALIGTATTKVTTVGTVSVTLLNAKISRKYFLIVNTGTATDCYYQLAATATLGSGTPLVKGNSSNSGFGSYEMNPSIGIYTGALSVITRAGTTSVLSIEY